MYHSFKTQNTNSAVILHTARSLKVLIHVVEGYLSARKHMANMPLYVLQKPGERQKVCNVAATCALTYGGIVGH